MSKIILVIAAHPDDEVLGCAGTMAKHVDCGDSVHVLFMTDGVGSRNTISDKDIKIRQMAAQRVSEVLGLASTIFFTFPDNQMDTIPMLNVVKSIEDIISKLQPELIYTHHIGDLNIDHQVTHKAVMTACRPEPEFCVKEIYSFEVLSSTEWQTPGLNVFTPNMFIDITKYINIKRDLLGIYTKEMRRAPHSRSIENILQLNSLRGNSVGLNYAEAFSILRKIN